MGKLLVTTSDQRTWKLDEDILFLGNWCCLPSESEKWQNLNVDVLPYHWDNSEKYHSDYHYLDSCYEEVLRTIVPILNKHHKTNHGVRYWRILIGPWLYLFIHVLYDRWSMIERIPKKNNIKAILVLDPEDELIPRDLRGMNPDDTRWNQFLYACAIKEMSGIKWKEILGEKKDIIQGHIVLKDHNSLILSFKKLVRFILNKLTFKDEYFLISTYLPRKIESYLLLSLRQIPKFWISPSIPQIFPNLDIRRTLVTQLKDSDNDKFKVFLSKMLFRQIPTIYLEGYSILMKKIEELPWPTKPKGIFTSNAYQFDEVFQAWTAKHAEAGTPLIIGQHGGFYGTGRVIAGEDHQVKIADRFLTWGWSDKRPSVYPFYSLINMGKKKMQCDPNGDLLLVTVPIRTMSFKCSSWAVGPNQSQHFVNDQLNFVQAIDKNIQKKLVVRIHKELDKKMNSAFIPKWKNKFPDVRIDFSQKPIKNIIQKSRLFIYTYNSTGFIEALSNNIPTVIFWNPDYWQLRDNAKPFFKILEDAKIFFTNPISAAHHVNEIWTDINKWWLLDTVQTARTSFCEQYFRTTNIPIKEIRKALIF